MPARDRAQMYAEANPTLELIRELGAERAQARARATELSHQLAPLLQKAAGMGIPKTDLATIAQISRPALAQMLDPTTPPE
jgi:hypothetical protein